MVPQDSLLFEGTIAENIGLNDPTLHKDIIEAATIACAHDFIMTLPQGYATILRKRKQSEWWATSANSYSKNNIRQSKTVYYNEATSALD